MDVRQITAPDTFEMPASDKEKGFLRLVEYSERQHQNYEAKKETNVNK